MPSSRVVRGLAWPAMVLTAGLGTRLLPLSAVRAKPALPVAGVPLAGRILRWLSGAGVRDAVLNLHHLPGSVRAAVGDGTAFGVRVRYSEEPTLLGSGGGPARALPLLAADRFLIVNGDTLTDLDVAALAARHVASGASVTLAVVPHPDPLRYGGVDVGADGCVTGFARPGPENRGWLFIGVQAVDAGVFRNVDPDVPCETINGLYRDLVARVPGAVRAFASTAAFFDIGTAADYLATCLGIARSEGAGGVIAGARAVVEDGAAVTRSVLWDDVRVARGAVLDECVVADGAAVPPGARLARRVVVREPEREPGPGETRLGDLLIAPLDARRPAPAP
ncbi:MAG TPA: NDP-sugar synthase [Vicinamibacterales bacterium]|nr:NDP-sugar synthase [Vicinamibacterales bacterium]HPW20630.1 NDP-sugar synthase [Vicinamibacterales bacterium]